MKYTIIDSALAKAIAYYRQEMGLTQAELGEMVGMSGLQISRIETQRIHRVLTERVAHIREILKITDDSIPEYATKRENQNCYCRICGAKLYEDSVYCHTCGTKIIVR